MTSKLVIFVPGLALTGTPASSGRRRRCSRRRCGSGRATGVLLVDRGAELLEVAAAARLRRRATGTSTGASSWSPASVRCRPLIVSDLPCFGGVGVELLRRREQVDELHAVRLRDLGHRVGVELEVRVVRGGVGVVRVLVLLVRDRREQHDARRCPCRCSSSPRVLQELVEVRLELRQPLLALERLVEAEEREDHVRLRPSSATRPASRSSPSGGGRRPRRRRRRGCGRRARAAGTCAWMSVSSQPWCCMRSASALPMMATWSPGLSSTDADALQRPADRTETDQNDTNDVCVDLAHDVKGHLLE